MRKKSRFKPGWVILFIIASVFFFVLVNKPVSTPTVAESRVDVEYKVELISMDVRARGITHEGTGSHIYDITTNYVFRNAGPACSARFDLPEWAPPGNTEGGVCEFLENGVPVDFSSANRDGITDVGLSTIDSGWRSEFEEGEVKNIQVRYFLKPTVMPIAEAAGNGTDISKITRAGTNPYSSAEVFEIPVELGSGTIEHNGALNVEIEWDGEYPEFLVSAEPPGGKFEGDRFTWHMDEPGGKRVFKVMLYRTADYMYRLDDVHEMVRVLTDKKYKNYAAGPSDRDRLEMLRIARNSIFARLGYPFGGGEMSKYFGSLEWYSPDPHYRDASLTTEDRAMVAAILEAEEKLK